MKGFLSVRQTAAIGALALGLATTSLGCGGGAQKRDESSSPPPAGESAPYVDPALYVSFKFFDHQEKRDLRDLICEVPGIDPADVQEISADDPNLKDHFTFKLTTDMSYDVFQAEYEAILEEENSYRFETRYQETSYGSILTVIQRR